MILAVAYMLSAWVIRKQYSQALIQMLEQEDFSFLLSQGVSNLTVADPATLNTLRKKLEESKSYEFTLFLAKLISQLGGKEAISILGEAAHAATDARQRAAIIDVLVAADTRGEAVRQLYTDFLADPDGRVRQAALAGLSELAGPDNPEFLSLALRLLSDPDVEVQAHILPALLYASDPTYQTPASQTLNTFLQSEDVQQRLRGIRVLHQVNDIRFIEELVKYLADPADEVRLEAALTLEALSNRKMPLAAVAVALDAIDSLLHDPIERVRQAALIVLGRIGTYESHEVIIGALTDASPQVRATAIEVLTQIGRAAIPAVHAQLDSPDPQLRKMSTVVLSRINRREFSPLIGSHITGNLLAIYRSYGYWAALSPCRQYPGIGLTQSALRERNEQLIAEIFYLLEAIHDPGAIKIVAESLRSDTARTRANAVEALETLTTPHTAKLIAPFFEPDLAPVKLLEMSQDTWDMQHPNTAEAISQLFADANDPWSRAMMTHALGEMGAALVSAQANDGSTQTATGQPASPEGAEESASPEKTSPSTSPREEHRARRFRPADLLGALAELGDHDKPSDQGTPTRRSRLTNPLDMLAGSNPAKSPSDEKEVPGPPPLPSNQPDPTAAPLSSPSGAIGNGHGPFTLPEIRAMLQVSLTDPSVEVRLAAQTAQRLLAGLRLTELLQQKEEIVLSTIEKIIFLKEVPFFQGMTIDQLKVLASICEEEVFEEDTRIFNEEDLGGALYVIVSGRVGIERSSTRKGSFARLATLGPHSYFGEMTLFDNGPRSAAAVALQDTLTLSIRREPVIALARQYPDLSLELISVLSQRLRECNNRVAELTRTRPRELHKLFDQFD
jgi:HEAT repeat protein